MSLSENKLRNISQLIWVEMRKEPVRFYGLITFSSIVSILCFYFYDFLEDLIILAFLVWVPFVFWIGTTAVGIREKFWREVAQSFGWEYVGYEGNIANKGTLFLDAGASPYFHNVIVGTQQGRPIRIFESGRIIPTDNRKKTSNYKKKISFSGFSFRFSGNFPHLYLNRKKNGLNFISGAKYQVSLPAKFEENFTLYAPKEYEIEALQIFTPDILEFLLQEDFQHDIEFIQQEMFILRRGYINSVDVFEKDLKKVIKVAQKLQRNLDHMRFVPIPKTAHNLKVFKSTKKVLNSVPIQFQRKRQIELIMVFTYIIIFMSISTLIYIFYIL